MVEKIKFLSDQPLRADEIRQVKFGHEGIAETVKNIVLACPTPFTIGLFGKWGTGKSTITNILQEKLEQEGVVVVNFDVWKYEKDSLRRTFLQSVVDAFDKKGILPEGYSLEKELYLTLTVSSEDEPKFSWKMLKNIPALITTILQRDIKYIINADQRSITYKSIESPEQFEAKFGEILKYSKGKKVAIVVDNLDRCSHKRATELLSTIKTFLDVPKNKAECIFIIPCDDDAIKEHLENIYGGNNSIKEKPNAYDPDEFLRKFFNTYVRIPDFIDTELQDYTEELLKETGAKKLDNSEVAYVITTAFRENPRQIKQFINTLLSHYLLAQEREESQNPLIVPKGTITDNVGFLAKLLVIRHKFPEAYKKIKEERLDSTEITQLMVSYPKLKEHCPGLEEFLNSTSSIPKRRIRSTRPFIYLKQSEDELKIPNVEDLEVALVDNKQDIVNKEFKHLLQSPTLLKEYCRFISSLMKENKRRSTPLLNIIKSSLTALEENKIEFPNTEYYNEVARFLGGKLRGQLGNISPPLIFNQVINRCDKQLMHNIISSYIQILSKQGDKENTLKVTDEWTYGLFQQIVNNPSIFKKNKKGISKALSETYYFNIDILSLFKDKPDIQKDLISEDVLSKFVSRFSEDDIKNKDILNDKIQLLLNFKNVMTLSVIEEIISKFSELLKSENQRPFSEEKTNFLCKIEDILDAYHELIIGIDDEKVLVTFKNVITQGINAIGDWNQKKIFIPTCLWLRDILPDSQKTDINTLIINFCTNTDLAGIKYVLNKLDKDARQEVIEEYWSVFKDRVIQQQDIFDTIWSFSGKEKRKELFRCIINSNQYQWGLDKLKKLEYKTDFRRDAVSILLNRVTGVPIPYKSDFYKAINAMKCGRDANLRRGYFNQLKTLLKTSDLDSQEVGYDALLGADYLSEPDKREIARDIIEWLMKLEPVGHTHEYAIKSVTLNWGILTQTDKNNYIHIIFDKILKRSSNIDDIRMGLGVIQKIKPRYGDGEYRLYFDDILDRIEKEGDNDIKNELIRGLLKIKPQKLSKMEKEFWKKLEKHK